MSADREPTPAEALADAACAAELGGEQREEFEAPEYIDEEAPHVTTGWRVRDIQDADWALSRVQALEAEMSENEALAGAAIERLEFAIGRIRERTRHLNDRAMRGVTFFRDRVAAWATENRGLLLKGGKKKSRDLIHGRIGWRATGGGLEVVDDVALLGWAKEQPPDLELVRSTEEPAVGLIKKHAKAQGLVPPGMRENPGREELFIDVEPAVAAGGE